MRLRRAVRIKGILHIISKRIENLLRWQVESNRYFYLRELSLVAGRQPVSARAS
jgi:hypothetical protein